MNSLLLCIIANVLVSVYPADVVEIHEWGVILLDESYIYARGCPEGYIDEYGYYQEYPMAEVTAPVVYFHGAECSGDLIVEIPRGSLTLTYPSPDTLIQYSDYSQRAVWEDLRLFRDEGPESTESMLTGGSGWDNCFSWATPLWRNNPANVVSHTGSDYEDKFIYYESSLVDPVMFIGDFYNYEGDVLLFFAEDGEMVCTRSSVPDETDAIGETLSDIQIMTVLSGWAHGELLPEEIYSLWETWKPLLKTRCEREYLTMMLFPLTDEQVNAVSMLGFETTEGLDVEFERLLLGLGSI